MRLNLNKTLRAALIAAVSVVGFTITQAQAVTLTEVISMESMASQATITAGTSVSSSWQIADGVVYDFDGTGYLGGIKDGDLLAALKGDQYVTVAAWINPSVTKVDGDGCAIFGYGGQNDGVKLIAHNAGSLKVTTKGRADFTNSATGIDVNSWELVAVTMHKNGSNLDIKYMLNDAFGDVVSNKSANAATTDSFAIGSGNSEGRREQFKGSIGNLTVFTSSDWATYEDVSNLMSSAPTEIVAVDMTWNGAGSSDAWNTTATNWTKGGDPAAYVSGVATTAIFDTTASAKTVQLGAALKAKDVKVGAGYTFDMNGNTLTAKKLTVDGEGASLTLTGTGSLTVSEIAASGKTITISEGAVLQGAGAGTISGNGTYVLNGTASLGNIALGDGWTGTVSLTAVDANNLNFDNLTKGANSTLELRGYKGYSTNWYDNRTNVQNIHLVNDASRGYAWKMNAWGSTMTTVGIYSGTWTGDGTLSYETYSGAQVKNVNQKFTGDLSAWNGTLKLDKNGTLQLTVALSNPLWGAAIDRNQGVINMIVEKNAEFAQSVSVTSMDVNAGQTVTLKGASTIDTMKGAGALTIDAGANTVTLKGVEALAKSITLTSGTLSLNGTINISNDMPITGGGASYSGGQNQGNGFQTVEGLLQVVTLNGGTLTEGTVSYTYGGKEIATKLTDGAINVAPTTSYSIFYTKVANTTESMEAAQAVAEEHQDSINSVVMSNSTTLAADIARSYAISLEDGASATVNTTAATTVTSLTGPVANQTLTLGGSDVLTIDSANGFAGNVNVTGGTVKLGSTTALGAHNTNKEGNVIVLTGKTITIGAGATVDVNGKGDAKYAYTLAGGTLTNNGDAIGHNMAQTSGLILTANSYIGSEGSKEMWVLGAGYASNSVDLADHTLTKKGSGTFGFANSTITAGTIQVDAGTVQFSDGGSLAANLVLNGGTIAGTLTPSTNIDITAQKNATINNLTFSIADGQTVTLKTAAEQVITFANNLTLTTGEMDVSGTLNVSHDIDLSSNGASTATLSLKGGSETTAAGMWMASGASLLMEEGAVLNIGGLQIVGTGDGGIDTEAANEKYGTGKAAFSITNATVTSTGDDVTLGNTLSGVDVFVAEGSSLTLKTAADSVTVNAGGTINKGEGGSISNLTVENGGTIGEGIDATEVGIAAESTATFAQGIQDASGVTFSKEGGVQVENTNVGGPAIKYAINQDAASVTADELLVSGELANDIVVNNELHVASIVNNSDKALTLTHITSDVQSVEVASTNVTIQNASTATLADLTIGTGATVAVYVTDELAATEGTVTITDTLTAGGAKLLANLTLLGHEGDELLTWNLYGQQMTLGSTLTLDTESGLIQLDDATMQEIAGLTLGGYWELVVDGGTGLQYNGNEWYDGVFSRTYTNDEGVQTQLGGDYKVQLLDGGNSFGIVKVSNVPEPTTGTLSLLALMALAARRRRK